MATQRGRDRGGHRDILGHVGPAAACVHVSYMRTGTEAEGGYVLLIVTLPFGRSVGGTVRGLQEVRGFITACVTGVLKPNISGP